MFPHRGTAVRSQDFLKGRGCFKLVFEYNFFFLGGGGGGEHTSNIFLDYTATCLKVRDISYDISISFYRYSSLKCSICR